MNGTLSMEPPVRSVTMSAKAFQSRRAIVPAAVDAGSCLPRLIALLKLEPDRRERRFFPGRDENAETYARDPGCLPGGMSAIGAQSPQISTSHKLVLAVSVEHGTWKALWLWKCQSSSNKPGVPCKAASDWLINLLP